MSAKNLITSPVAFQLGHLTLIAQLLWPTLCQNIVKFTPTLCQKNVKFTPILCKRAMIFRQIINELTTWKQSAYRKPLLIRGARQVGKTTVIHQFGKSYDEYIYLNLEKKEDASIFSNYSRFSELVDKLFFIKNARKNVRDTLVFIDEIQEIPEAINLLRYFYEDYPELHVIAAGSLLETILTEKTAMPVGRIEYRVLRPLSFYEFLRAMGEVSVIEQYEQLPMDAFAHERFMELFKTYSLIGGMPEIVSHYVDNKDLTALKPLYESLLIAYISDVEKYARNSGMVQVIRHVIMSMSNEAGSRIKFEGFGQANYGSREVGEAMRMLEKAFLLHLVYPVTNPKLPIFSNKKKSPRLQLLDTGMMNYAAGIQYEIILNEELDNTYQGRVAEHIVGQELLTLKFNALAELNFWTREKKGTVAEVDFIYQFKNLVIPVEVKSGATGRLKSLHYFMDQAPHPYAVRCYGGKLSINTLKTPAGKEFFLLNLPYYLTGQIENYIKWLIEKTA